jgi:hypothetical protein
MTMGKNALRLLELLSALALIIPPSSFSSEHFIAHRQLSLGNAHNRKLTH